MGTFKIPRMYDVNKAEQKLAKQVIHAVTALPEWYENLEYLYSVLGENSNLSSHLFDLLAEYDGRTWALIIWQEIAPNGGSSFYIRAKPYDPDTYVDHAKALQEAMQSCPVPQ